MPSRVTPPIGQTFNRLTVRSVAWTGRAWATCDCACGKRGVVIRLTAVTSGKTQSCGCLVSQSSSARWRRKREADALAARHEETV